MKVDSEAAPEPDTAGAPRHHAAPLERFALRSLGGLVAVVLIGAAFGVLAAMVQLRWEPMRSLDHAIADGLNRAVAGDDLLRAVLIGITDLGGTAVLVWLLVVVGGWLLVRGQRRMAIYVGLSAFGAMLLNALVKQLVGRLRPAVEDPFYTVAGASFPSGHAMSSFVAYGVLVLVFAPQLRAPVQRGFVAFVAVLVAAIGFTRLALGAHFLTDVVGGWLLGALWLAFTTVAFHHWRQEEHIPETGPLPGDERSADLRPVPPRQPHTVPHPWRGAGILIIGWVSITGALSGLGMLIVNLPAVPIDEAVSVWLANHRDPSLTAVLDVIGLLGATPLILAVAFTVWPLVMAVTRTWQPLLFLAITLIGEITLFLAISSIVDRSRPDVVKLNPDLPPTASFPSGHVAATIAVYTAAALLVWRLTRQRWRWIFVALAVAVPLAVAFQRLYGGVHHLTDIAAAILLAIPWTLLAWHIARGPQLSGRTRVSGSTPGRNSAVDNQRFVDSRQLAQPSGRAR